MKKYMKKLKLILIIVFGLLSSNTSSGQQNVWQSVVKNVTLNSLTTDDDGNIYACGGSEKGNLSGNNKGPAYSPIAIKYNSNGILQSQKFYTNTVNPVATFIENASTAGVVHDNHYYQVQGEAIYYGGGNGAIGLTSLIDAFSNNLSKNSGKFYSHNSSTFPGASLISQTLFASKQINGIVDGLVVGSSYFGLGSDFDKNFITITKTDLSGNIIWTKDIDAFNFTQSEQVVKQGIQNGENYFFTGSTNGKILFLKTDLNGANTSILYKQLTLSINGTNQNAFGCTIAALADGNYVIGGTYFETSTNENQAFLMIVDGNGNFINSWDLGRDNDHKLRDVKKIIIDPSNPNRLLIGGNLSLLNDENYLDDFSFPYVINLNYNSMSNTFSQNWLKKFKYGREQNDVLNRIKTPLPLADLIYTVDGGFVMLLNKIEGLNGVIIKCNSDGETSNGAGSSFENNSEYEIECAPALFQLQFIEVSGSSETKTPSVLSQLVENNNVIYDHNEDFTFDNYCKCNSSNLVSNVTLSKDIVCVGESITVEVQTGDFDNEYEIEVVGTSSYSISGNVIAFLTSGSFTIKVKLKNCDNSYVVEKTVVVNDCSNDCETSSNAKLHVYKTEGSCYNYSFGFSVDYTKYQIECTHLTVNGLKGEIGKSYELKPGENIICVHALIFNITNPTISCCIKKCTTIFIPTYIEKDTVLTYCPESGQTVKWWDPCISLNNKDFKIFNTTNGGKILEYDSKVGFTWNGILYSGCIVMQFRPDQNYQIEYTNPEGCIIKILRIKVAPQASISLQIPTEVFTYCFPKDLFYNFNPNITLRTSGPWYDVLSMGTFNPTNFLLSGPFGVNFNSSIPHPQSLRLVEGVYTFTVWDKHKCMSITQTIIIRKKNCNSGHENEVMPMPYENETDNRNIEIIQLQINPNPTASVFKVQPIDGSFVKYNKLEIFTIKGEMVESYVDVDSNKEFNLSNNSESVYIVKVLINEEWQTLKILKAQN